MRNAVRNTVIGAAVVLVTGAVTGVALASGPATPLTASNGGVFSCPAAGGPPLMSADGTVCSNDGTKYVFEHGVVDAKTVQVTLMAPARGYIGARLSAPDPGKVELSVGRPGSPAAAGYDYHGAVSGFWLVSK